jgi:hypothetical protein
MYTLRVEHIGSEIKRKGPKYEARHQGVIN